MAEQKAGMKRTIVLPIDNSEHSESAFTCKFICLFYIRIALISYLVTLCRLSGDPT